MNDHSTAIYAASFDPITIGHLDIIQRASLLFSRLLVVVGENPKKSNLYSFDIREREEMATLACKQIPLRIEGQKRGTIYITANGGKLTARYAQAYGNALFGTPIRTFVRGIRDLVDFQKEMNEFYITQQLVPGIEFVPLFCKPDLGIVSSSMVKGLVGFEGWQEDVKRYLPPAIHDQFIQKFKKQESQ
jgi:pantetheine-phosphate adenylyltransferase